MHGFDRALTCGRGRQCRLSFARKALYANAAKKLLILRRNIRSTYLETIALPSLPPPQSVPITLSTNCSQYELPPSLITVSTNYSQYQLQSVLF